MEWSVLLCLIAISVFCLMYILCWTAISELSATDNNGLIAVFNILYTLCLITISVLYFLYILCLVTLSVVYVLHTHCLISWSGLWHLLLLQNQHYVVELKPWPLKLTLIMESGWPDHIYWNSLSFSCWAGSTTSAELQFPPSINEPLPTDLIRLMSSPREDWSVCLK